MRVTDGAGAPASALDQSTDEVWKGTSKCTVPLFRLFTRECEVDKELGITIMLIGFQVLKSKSQPKLKGYPQGDF